MRSRTAAALAAVAAAGATGLVAVLASGVGAGPASADPAVTNPGGVGSPMTTEFGRFMAEMNSAHHVVVLQGSDTSRTDLGGFAVDGIAVTQGTDTVPDLVLVRGRDGAVWYRERGTTGTWSRWLSLGGKVVNRPAVVSDGNIVLVEVVGADGRMYERMRTGTGWAAGWQAVNATFTGSLAAGLTNSGFVVYGRGGDGRLWTATRSDGTAWAAFRPVPTRTGLDLGEPAVDSLGGGVYVRGADGACWTFDPAHPQLGWQSLGGRFEAGFSAYTNNDIGLPTAVFGRGLNHRIYELDRDSNAHWSLFDFA